MPFESRKSLGQNFLTNEAVARAEAAHAIDKTVLEIGPGKGMLTRELCNNAKKVIAVEKDRRLFLYLDSTLRRKNLELINADFFDLGKSEVDIDGIDIVIANIPYNLSSKVISWLYSNNKEAVLCLQKEFVEHMLAIPGTKHYSRLSVMCALSFRLAEIMKVPRKNFNPKPRVDSEVIFLKPKKINITKSEELMINLLMQHKKKTLKNAILDSRRQANWDDGIARFITENRCDERVFKMNPEEILEVARKLTTLQKL